MNLKITNPLNILLQKTVLTLVSLEEAIIEEIVQESDDRIIDTEKNLLNLLKMGFIRKKQINGKTIYLCSILS